MHKLFFSASISFLTFPAFAYVSLITPVGGQSAQGEGRVSAHGALTGEERFNTGAQPGTCARQDPLGIAILGQPGTDFNIANDSVLQRRLNPVGDSSCYLSVGAQFPSSTIALDFSNASATTPLTYLGFYWGSMDQYNSITFLDGNGSPVPFFSNTGDYALTGEHVAEMLGYPAYIYGLSPYPSVFVEFTFPAADNVQQAVLSTTDYAFELDNIGYVLQAPQTARTFSAVPEPATRTLTLAGLGCLLLARLRRASRT